MTVAGNGMTTMVDEIVQALINLGCRASSVEIINEVERLHHSRMSVHDRKDLYNSLKEYSAKYKLPNGEPYFYMISPGIWATKVEERLDSESRTTSVSRIKNKVSAPKKVSIDAVANALKTIKEYRDYYDPQKPDWIDYIYEIFHVLGFATQRINSRLFFINDMGGVTSKVLVLCSYPGEDEKSIAPGISWDSHLQFATSHYQVKKGILTNGLKLQIVDYHDNSGKPLMSWSDLDVIVREQNPERFFSIYKTFSSLGTS
jgi:hypothetical protein